MDVTHNVALDSRKDKKLFQEGSGLLILFVALQ